jgi:hypothetical protein
MTEKQTRVRNDRHDAYYDPQADVWLERKCGDPECEFCATRPDRPSQAETGDAA